MKLCDPAKVYILLSILSVFMYIGAAPKNFAKKNLVIHVVSVIIWTIILNWICTLKYGIKISWFLVFLPIIFITVMMIFFTVFIDKLDLSKEDIEDILDEECDKCKQ